MADKRKMWLVAALLWAVAAGPVAASVGVLRLTTESFPPFNYLKDGEIVGRSTELVRAALDDAGVDYEMRIMPWARAFRMGEHEPMTCVFSTAHTPARHDRFQWIEPLDRIEWVLAAPRDAEISIASLDEARRYRIGTYNEDVIEGYLLERGFDVQAARRDPLNVRLLKEGRIDLWATMRNRFDAADDDSLEVVHVFNHTVLALACNHSVPADVVRRIQHSLDELEQSGAAQLIRARHP